MKTFNEFDLTNFNSYRVKSKCKTAYFPESEEDVVAIYTSKKDFILLGSGHNVILSKAYYDADFVIFNGNFEAIKVDETTHVMSVEAGATMLDVSKAAFEHGLSGLEVFYDIPSSLGGAVVMNAGAGGEEIKDVLLKVRYLDLEDFKVKEIDKDEIGFEYRNSLFQKQTNKVILKAWLKLKPVDKETVKEKMLTIKEKRWAKQPKEYPNAGSVYKRPVGRFVGPMLDELGLKGFTVGGAQVSKKHSGFIVNFNEATGQDIIDIITHVRAKVKAKFDVDLEVEQRII